MRLATLAPGVALAFVVAGCGTRPVAQPEGHIQPESRSTASIPAPVRSVPLPPPPEAREAELKYSVVVAQQPVRDVLLAMARETRLNFDIHPGVEGTVNLNAIDQTLKQILNRIARQVDVRWEIEGQTIMVMPDTPFLRNYKVDYVNMSRDVTGTIGVQSNVVTPPSATGTSSSSASNVSQNSSLLKVDNVAKNRFWETLEKNIKDLLRETDKELPPGSSETFVQSQRQGQAPAAQRTPAATRRSAPGTVYGAIAGGAPDAVNQQAEIVEQRLTFREAASVIINAETGIVSVRATSRQHEKVSEFISQVAGSARRQVLIEATVVEVVLNDNYQSGVDWSALGLNGLGYNFTQSFIGNNLATPPFFAVEYNNPNANIFGTRGSIKSTVKLLDSFGNTRVLSSPKIMAVNNQTAVLKVVDNRVYFSVQAQVTPGNNNSAPIVAYTTTQNVVPVGFVMNVTPQISDNDVVVLNVRPTVSRILGFVNDPNPDLARANVVNRVPEIQSREFESVLRVPSGSVAILGGLMQDSFDAKRDGLPILSRIPVLGDAVSYRNDTANKSELVIFLRPVVVREASVNADLAEYRRYLPDREFFRDAQPISPQLEESLQRLEREGLRGNPAASATGNASPREAAPANGSKR
jgi:MSHA biogenesis protein MshL